MLTPQPRNETL